MQTRHPGVTPARREHHAQTPLAAQKTAECIREREPSPIFRSLAGERHSLLSLFAQCRHSGSPANLLRMSEAITNFDCYRLKPALSVTMPGRLDRIIAFLHFNIVTVAFAMGLVREEMKECWVGLSYLFWLLHAVTACWARKFQQCL